MTKWFSVRKADFDKTLFFGVGLGGELPRIVFAIGVIGIYGAFTE